MLLPYLEAGRIEAGCDEAGRGCLAGPVFAAAVIFPDGYENELLNDSKRLSEHQRDLLRDTIEREAASWAVGIATQEEIDSINILNASILAMHRAIDALSIRPQHLLIDGNRFRPYQGISHTCIVKGDAKMMTIAAASILAKTHRDEFMAKIHQEYPQYGWNINKGYPTKAHREAIPLRSDALPSALVPIARQRAVAFPRFIRTKNSQKSRFVADAYRFDKPASLSPIATNTATQKDILAGNELWLRAVKSGKVNKL